MTRPLITGAIAAVAASYALASSTLLASTDVAVAAKPPIVLSLHPGGYLMGAPDPAEAAYFRQHGFASEAVDYTLGGAKVATKSVRLTIQRYRTSRRVYVIGESAGGGLAAYAGARGWADGIVDVAGTTNLMIWGPKEDRAYFASPADRRRLSAVAMVRRHHSPGLILHSRQDRTVPFIQATEMSARTGWQIVELTGDHLVDRSYQPRALRFFRALM